MLRIPPRVRFCIVRKFKGGVRLVAGSQHSACRVWLAILGVMKRTFFISLFITAAVAFTGTGQALAAKPTGATTVKTPLGIDISYPQCGQRVPTDHAFGIVGVNGGIATSTNPCLKEQLVWANKALVGTNQPKVQLYVNTANPGGLGTASWPTSNVDTANQTPVNPYGNCDGSDTKACAWLYGWNRALEDARDRFQPAARLAGLDANPAAYVWWLDVELDNTWKAPTSSFNTESNAAVLEGMTAQFTKLGARVGLYSTAYQWGQVVGNSVSQTSNLNGLPNWRPGGASLATAKDACNAAPLTFGGTVVLTQFVSKNIDYNYPC